MGNLSLKSGAEAPPAPTTLRTPVAPPNLDKCISALERLRSRSWAFGPNARARATYVGVRRVLLKWFKPDMVSDLPMTLRVLSSSVLRDRLDLVRAQARVERGIRVVGTLSSIEWADATLRLAVRATLGYADGTFITLSRRGGRVYWQPPQPLTEDLTVVDQDLDITSEIPRTSASIIVRHRANATEYQVPVTGLPAVEDQLTISQQGWADMDLAAVAAGRALDSGVWDIFVEVNSCGWRAVQRLPCQREQLGDVEPTILGRLGASAVPYITEKGNLSIRVSVRPTTGSLSLQKRSIRFVRRLRRMVPLPLRQVLLNVAALTLRRSRGMQAVPPETLPSNEALEARCERGLFTLCLGSPAGFKTLIVRRRGSRQALRIDPTSDPSGRPRLTFSVPLDHLLPRSTANITYDLYCEERGEETRIRSKHFQGTPGSCDGITAFPFTTSSGHLSLSLVRSVTRRPLRVVLLPAQLNFSGGKTTFLFRLASILQSAGFDVTLTPLWLTSGPLAYQPPEEVALAYIDSEMLQAPGEQPFQMPLPTLSASERTIERMKAYLANIDADVVYLPDYDSPLYDLILDSLPSHVLSILGDHNGGRYSAALAQGTVPTNHARNRFFRAAIQNFDAVHVINPIVRPAYEASTAKPVFCIPNSVAIVESATADFLSHRRIIAAGRLIPYKGFEAIINAFATLRARHPQWTLDIYGTGESREPMRELISQLGAEDAINIWEPTRALLDEMMVSSLHVSASKIESFGLTMAEAMSVGLPVLSHYRNTGSAYLLADGRGFIAETSTIESLSAAMDDLLCRIESRDPAGTIQQTVSAARSFVRQISSESVGKSWKAEIDRLYDRNIVRLYG